MSVEPVGVEAEYVVAAGAEVGAAAESVTTATT
jgi:hypothetical protein